MLDKDIEKLNSETTNKDDHIIIGIRRLYIQEFVEANYGRKLTESELEELSWLVWENDWDLMQWLDEAIGQIVEEAKPEKQK
jgi:succinate dehydrogenase flavin-adding protein (antitoxin of CptAB toxin-antitoxin module)